MTTPQELIVQIETLIVALNKQRQSLTEGSKAFEARSQQIGVLASHLRSITSDAELSSKALAKLETQIRNVTTELAKPPTERSSKKFQIGTGEDVTRMRLRGLPENILQIDEESRKQSVADITASMPALKEKARLLRESMQAAKEAAKAQEQLNQQARSAFGVKPAGPTPASTVSIREIPDVTPPGKTSEKELAKQEREAEKQRKRDEAIAKKAAKEKAKAEIRAQEEAAREILSNTAMADAIKAREEKIEAARQKVVEKTARDPEKFLKETGVENKAANDRRLAEEKKFVTEYQKIKEQERSVEEESNRAMAAQVQEREKFITQKRKQEESIRRDQQKFLESLEKNQRIQAGGGIASGAAGAKNLFGVAQKVDPMFTAETLKSVRETGGVSKATFEYRTEEGVIKSLTLAVDKFGKVLVDTQSRFRSFSSGVIRNVTEALKWSIAIGLVYGPMQKLGELMQVMVENETALAAVTVTLGNAQKSINEIFQASLEISQAVGENTKNVIEAYNLAYRATGGITDSSMRFVTANKLLTDALTLSKLSALNESEAIDTLAAALKQVGQAGEPLEQTLSRGPDLLNKWIAVSKVANVDLATLATGFSVVGDAAETAGIDTDKLNAVIATIAETTSMGGKEVANTARAMIAGFQSDQAIKALNALGISMTDVEGRARNFLDVSFQIARMREENVLSEKQFSELTLAIGGGTRRQAPVSTFISNLGKINQIETISQAANAKTGQSFDAMGKQLDTVSTASTRLGNAFQGLAEALGESGGVLDLTKNFLNILNSLVTAFTDVMDVAGKAGPVLLTTMAAIGIAKGQGPKFMPSILGGIGSIGSNAFLNAGTTGLGGGARFAPLTRGIFGNDETLLDRSKAFGGFISNPRNLGIAGGIASGVFAAGENLSQGKQAQAAGNILGSVAGTALGTVLGGPVGALIGANLGSSIAEGFVNASENFKPQFQDLFAEVWKKSTAEGVNAPQLTEAEAKAKQQEDALANIKKLVEGTGANPALTKAFYDLTGKLQDIFTKGGTGFQGYTESQTLMVMLGVLRESGKITEEQFKEAIKQMQEAAKATATEEEGKRQESIFKPIIDNIMDAEKQALLSDLGKDRIGVAPYRQGRQAVENLGPVGTQFYQAFGQRGNLTPEQTFQMTGKVISRMKPEEYAGLTEMTGMIQELDYTLKSMTGTETDYQEKLALRSTLITQATAELQKLNQQVMAQATLLEQVDLSTLSQADALKVLDRAMKDYQKDLDIQVNEGVITEENKRAILATLDEIIYKSKDAADKVQAAPLDYINQAMDDLIAEGKIIEEKTQNIGFKQYDITQQQLESIINGPQYENLRKRLMAAGYTSTEEPEVALTGEGNIGKYTKDWKIVELLLQDILDVNQKQLDGMFNLPEGASFWIPAQTAALRPKDIGGGTITGGGGGVGTETTTTKKKIEETPITIPQEIKDLMKYYEQVYKVDEKKAAQPPENWEENVKKFRQADKDSMLGTPVPFQAAGNPIMEFLKGFMSMFTSTPQVPGTGIGTGAGQPPAFDLQNIFQNISSNLSTKLNLNIDNKMTVNLNGRQVWAAVKPYASEDLLKYASGASTKSINVI